MTVTHPPQQSPPGTGFNRDDLLVEHVRDRVASLQRQYLADSPAAVGALARLRRAVNASPGSDPSIWFETLDGAPDLLLGTGDEPSTYERAIHAAVTLYAIHQQSQSTRMHQFKYPLGRSIRLLVNRVSPDSTKNDNPVLRRFHALGTASSLPETLHHLRGLVTRLRSEAIGLEYGQLAQDLRRLQVPRTAAGVRLQWGRDYHRTTSDPMNATETDDPAPDARADDVPTSDSTTGDPA